MVASWPISLQGPLLLPCGCPTVFTHDIPLWSKVKIVVTFMFYSAGRGISLFKDSFEKLLTDYPIIAHWSKLRHMVLPTWKGDWKVTLKRRFNWHQCVKCNFKFHYFGFSVLQFRSLFFYKLFFVSGTLTIQYTWIIFPKFLSWLFLTVHFSRETVL